jgi:hypothetical protein
MVLRWKPVASTRSRTLQPKAARAIRICAPVTAILLCHRTCSFFTGARITGNVDGPQTAPDRVTTYLRWKPVASTRSRTLQPKAARAIRICAPVTAILLCHRTCSFSARITCSFFTGARITCSFFTGARITNYVDVPQTAPDREPRKGRFVV